MSNITDYNQERRTNLCEAIKTLNAKENRFVFVDYITKDEREVINKITGGSIKIVKHPFVKMIHVKLRDDIAACFNMDKEKFSMNNGRSFLSSHDNRRDLDIQNPNLEEVLSEASMYQDSASYKGEKKAFHISGINAALAIVGPSTIFAKNIEGLYPDWNKINKKAITTLVQAEENQVAIFTQGSSGALHGWPFKDYETRVMQFVGSDDAQISDFILGNTFTQDTVEL